MGAVSTTVQASRNNGVSQITQVDNALSVNNVAKNGGFLTTLNPYDINMYLDYGPISIYNDDRTIQEDQRTTSQGWFFQPKIDGATISLYEGEHVVMYVQIENPLQPNNYESWSCNTVY